MAGVDRWCDGWLRYAATKECSMIVSTPDDSWPKVWNPCVAKGFWY